MNQLFNKAHTLPLSASEMMAKARAITGINIIDVDAVEPFSVLHRSFNEDACMSRENVRWVEGYLLRILSNRLRMQRDFSAHPEIAEQKIEAPIFICGMARTGSTKLQKLLASSSDFNWLPFWQSLNPSLYTGSPEELPEPRIKDTDDYVAGINVIAPEQKLVHEYATHEPEEEGFLMIHSLYSLCVGSTQLTGFMEWIMTQDFMRHQVEYLRDGLKYLQWQGLQSESKRWVLKAPHYFGHEPTIKAVFPDASLIMTHRLPQQTIPSLCSFFRPFNKPASAGTSLPSAYVDGNAIQIEQHIKNRETHQGLKFLDLYYKELTGSVESVANKIYAHIDIPLTSASLQRMLDWDKAHPIHAKGGHKYTLEEFGLTEQKIETKFSGYIALMNQLFDRNCEQER